MNIFSNQTPIPMSTEDVFRSLANINEEGQQQLANLIAEGAFTYMLFKMSEDGNEEVFDYIDQCYANWLQLTKKSLT